MSTETEDPRGTLSRTMSELSISSPGSASEDWDRSEYPQGEAATPRNSVAFPGEKGAGEEGETPTGDGKGKRTLSELMKVYAEKGTSVKFSPEEAARLAEVLGQWINSESSPYEGEDDFFSKSQDDLSLPKRSPSTSADGRPRGQSESQAKS
ncbi:hypothetical protein GLOTRDRAFT_116928 [Gloeophyllum trabeum ATCC 11539]|uniref:Uncharacterized protein n=1 Tax=Gloeophyllum trabeum (strain ATCC 11539 / FP-39264 / Madison 617) TaxID=670483 RepID=S7Q1Q7_GLOTA|nr:uncharacterized protein GLOTRDRAFT_116928 [Gloeophyllum trabeum ATCC 11539]EPQ53467.1 hypothetical protein GLOTRDRAFT_116928 [Gloeophyllum trabeum ATCC 11539]